MTHFASSSASDDDDNGNFGAPHRQDFRAARRRLIIALAIAVAVPLVSAATYGYVSYQRAVADKQAALERFAWIAESNLAHILDLNRELVSRVEDEIGSDDEDAIRSKQTRLHDKFRALVARHPFVAALGVVGRDGTFLVTSRLSAAPAISIGDRDDFRVTRDTQALLHVSMPERGRIHGTDIVNELIARSDENGQFIGAIVVSLRRAQLVEFYQQLRAHNPGLVLGLYRQDGGVLARVPTPRIANAPERHIPLAVAFAQKRGDGFMHDVSPMDGSRSMTAYRQAAGFPVYVSAGYPMTEVFYSWLRDDMTVIGVALAPCLCLCFLIVFSLRRLNAEEAAWRNWHRESSKRQRAEDAARHLQRMGALGNLVASVAHDFNNLLMVVTANMEIVRRKNYCHVKNEVNAVERASINARVLARRLMSVARKQPLQLHLLHLERWHEHAEPLIESALGGKIELRAHLPNDSLWTVKVDPVELTSALVNIAVNAKDAMSNGGEFHLRFQNALLHQQRYGLGPGEYVVIECTDTGTGMREDIARHAFEALFTTKAMGAGTGLGLAQVLAMAEQAGGTARLESAIGHGTTVFLYLPRWAGEEPPASDDMATVEPSRKEDATVLLVEDNEEVAAGLVAVLDVLGWRARHEATGDAALKVLEDGGEFDLVLSDIQMPGTTDGIALAEWIRKRRPRQHVTLMTGYADHLAEARRLGVSVLAKPFNADDLKALLTGVPVDMHG
jgi:signal transduction histidine kinase/CheY-like chemotaxis protein